MINLLQVDKSGSDIFEKDYSIAIFLDKKEVYGINIPQKIKDDVCKAFREKRDISAYNLINLSSEELIKIIRK